MGLQKVSFGTGQKNYIRAQRAMKAKLNQKTELLIISELHNEFGNSKNEQI